MTKKTWSIGRHAGWISLGDLLMKLSVLDEKQYYYHFHFEPNPLIRAYDMFLVDYD